MISEDLHRIRVIASKFDTKIKTFKTKYSKARYPRRFIKMLFETSPRFLMKVNLLLFHLISSNQRNRFHCLRCYILIKTKLLRNDSQRYYFSSWIRNIILLENGLKEIKLLFPLENHDLYPSCKIYKGKCSCGDTYLKKVNDNTILLTINQNQPNTEAVFQRHFSK